MSENHSPPDPRDMQIWYTGNTRSPDVKFLFLEDPSRRIATLGHVEVYSCQVNSIPTNHHSSLLQSDDKLMPQQSTPILECQDPTIISQSSIGSRRITLNSPSSLSRIEREGGRFQFAGQCLVYRRQGRRQVPIPGNSKERMQPNA